MLDNSKNSIGSEELDHLLNESFLEMDFNNPKNETIMQATANTVMLTDTYAGTHKANTNSSVRPSNSLMIWIISALSIAIASALFITSKSSDTKKEVTTITEQVDRSPENHQAIIQDAKSFPGLNAPVKKSQSGQKNAVTPPEERKTKVIFSDSSRTIVNQLKDKLYPEIDVSSSAKKDSGYVFPRLTEQEIKDNHKQKKKMIELLYKFSQKQYAEIPMGTFKYKGTPTSLHPFYMQNTEVSNLEYRTFLYDLLIQDRKEEFLKAKPDQKQWVTETRSDCFKYLVDSYFSDHAYDNHPVLNISRQGAEMYCAWLTIETNKVLEKKGKALINDVRIPKEEEWMYAAQGGVADAVYPWKLSESQNSKGCFLANFSYKKFLNTADTTKDCNKGKNMEAFSTGGHALDGKQVTVWVYSYNPNGYGVFGLSGNVAEMVKISEDGSVKAGTRGGSWDSDPEHIKILSEDEYAGKTSASPFIGFRPVISKNSIRIKMN